MEKDMSASEGSQWAMDCQAPNETHEMMNKQDECLPGSPPPG